MGVPLALARIAEVELDDGKADSLVLISSFNIEARYPDIKRSFRKKCTKEFAVEQMKNIKGIYQWLEEILK